MAFYRPDYERLIEEAEDARDHPDDGGLEWQRWDSMWERSYWENSAGQEPTC